MRKLLSCFAVLMCLAAPVLADTAGEPAKVHVRLIADRDGVSPGSAFTVAVEQDIAPGWHTYWSNPGEAGLATAIKWHLPPGWKAGPIQWPYPTRLPSGPLMDYGYQGEVWLLVDLAAPANAPAGTAVLKALVQVLVCAQVCVPEEANVETAVVIGPAGGPDAASAAEFAAARARLPSASPWPMHYAISRDLRLTVEAPVLAGAARPVNVQFFPDAAGLIVDAAPQRFSFSDNGLVVQLTPGAELAKAGALDGVLVLTSSDQSVQALRVHALAGPASSGRPLGLWLALLFALLGGLILNIMPCVLPVLAMKALAIAGQAGADRIKARTEALAYAAGAVLSFLAFGLLVMGLRAGGAAIGWGFQLQEPLVVALLALLMTAVGLNLSGVFEIAPVAAGEGMTRRGGLVGAFFTGVLAVAVAAPCTAPFMATAIGYGFTQEAPAVIGIFTALGFGFALPFLLLGLWPALQRLLPRPGAWMIRLKKILALPMYAAAAWLLWVLARQVDGSGLIAAVAAVAALAAALWIWGRMQWRSGRWRRLGIAAMLGLLVAGAFALRVVVDARPAHAAPSLHAGMAFEPYTPARLEALRRQGRAVFIDATASWCITCMVNEEAALSRPAVHEAFRHKNVALLVADWTNRNPDITALLDAHGRSGVPMYLYYAPGAAEPVILPQILTEGEVLRTIGD